ncbi:hypothetical protein Vadar_009265 [Vaccinium darrowii]|uniref:Uncharacterized protein n=1 Tax=Vaccinium darrowii TaxID=229202 RepID=A0ACB7XYK7_9ERIC|nr:hypothetical protein Vadar_009265 [Vaccinium darrowii]
MAEARSSGGLPIGYMYGSPMYESPIYVPNYPRPTFKIPTPRSLPTYDVSIPTSTTRSSNAEDETPFYSTSTVSPVYIAKSYLYLESPIYIPTAINQPTYDVPTTTANSAQGPPPPSTTTTPKTFEMEAQAYNSQPHNHQHGEGEEQPMKKPSSSGAVPPMPQGLGCIEEQPRIPFPSFIDVVLDSDFTAEEGEIYDKICVESDGFDCPYVRPEIKIPGLLKPYPLENISDVERKEVDYMADLGLKHYNDLNGSSYQLVEVIKATLRFSNGCIFSITLRAKDDKSGSPPQNFQARMYDSTSKYKVLFCRVEGNAEPTAIGGSEKHPGCWVPKPLIFRPVDYSSSGHLRYGSSSDVPTTTANNTECPPPLNTTTTTTALTPAPRMVSPSDATGWAMGLSDLMNCIFRN